MDRRSDWDVLVELCNSVRPSLGNSYQYIAALAGVGGMGFAEGFTGINRGYVSNEEMGAMVLGGLATARAFGGAFLNFFDENVTSDDGEGIYMKKLNHGFAGGLIAAAPFAAASAAVFYGLRFAGQGARMLAENYHLVDKMSKSVVRNVNY